MANNKVQLADGTVLMDTSGVTVTPEVLLTGYTALDKSGALITGTNYVKTQEKSISPTESAQQIADALNAHKLVYMLTLDKTGYLFVQAININPIYEDYEILCNNETIFYANQLSDYPTSNRVEEKNDDPIDPNGR